MSVTSGAHILEQINSSLSNNGLFWIGMPFAATHLQRRNDELHTGLGNGPLARICFRKYDTVELTIETMILKSQPTFRVDTFDAFTYYKSMMNADNIILNEQNKCFLNRIDISITTHNGISGLFTNTIMKPDFTILDLIEETSNIIPATGNEAIVYESIDLPFMVGGQFFPGVFSVDLSFSLNIIPIFTVGGIYGYMMQQPFLANLSCQMYENVYLQYQNLFTDASNLKNITIGPFTLVSAKFDDKTTSVSAGGVKKHTLNFSGKNLLYQRSI